MNQYKEEIPISLSPSNDATEASKEKTNGSDEELEEGELKDDDDDDDDDDFDDDNADNNAGENNNHAKDNIADNTNSRFSNFNNSDDNNNSGLAKESSYGDQRLHHDPSLQNNSSNFSANRGGHRAAYHQHPHQHHRRHMSPNAPPHPDMHMPFPPGQYFSNNSNDHYRYPPNHDAGNGPPGMPSMPPHMDPMAGALGMYARGGPGNAGPVQKVNVRCRFYSRTSNKCTWGDHCRFEHRDDSPGPGDVFDNRLPPGPGMMPGSRGPPPPMGAAERYPPYPGRHQPYSPMQQPPHPYGYGPYDQPPYPAHHSSSPPAPHHSMPPHHWRQQHSPYPPSSSSNHPPESVSPSLAATGAGPTSMSSSKQPPPTGPAVPAAPSSGGAPSPGYSSPSSSAVYERKHRLAYELAPWNDRSHPPQSKYDRGDPAASGYPPPVARGGFYRSHYSRDPYGREPLPPHMGGPPHPYPPSGYPPSHPSAYRGGPMGPHASHYRYMSSSQRAMPPDSQHPRSNKRGHDEDESSWSDSGSEDSILGQASSSKSLANKVSKKQHHQRQPIQAATESTSPKDPVDQGGSGTPPGEPLPEDRERQEMLLNKLKEIEDLMKKKKGEQEDPM